MNGFLVLGRCALDDVPLRLCRSKAEALTLAGRVTEDDVVEAAAHVIEVDVATFINVAVVEFRDGVPRPMEIIKSFGEAEEDGEVG
jgi:hypothetical protein